MFFSDMVDALHRRTWMADCVEMSLTQNEVAEPATFTGSGYLRQEADGQIHYKLYPRDVKGFDPFAPPKLSGVPGTLVGPDKYYRLEAHAQDGACWQASRTMAEVSTIGFGDGVRHFASGVAAEIISSEPVGIEFTGAHLMMLFFVEVEVPCNAVTETTSVVAGGIGRTASVLNVVSFHTRFGEFCISKRDGMVVVEVEAEQPFPPHFEVRIIEALALVLAKPLYWNVIRLAEKGTETVRVSGGSVVPDAKLPPPIFQERGIDITRGAWRLFEGYLALACTQPDDNYHPCSRHLFSVLEASGGAMSARGLALGVAVEGIVNTLFPGAGALPPTLKPIVKRLRAYFRAWPEFKDEASKEGLHDRVDTMLGRILDVGAKGKLYGLAKEQIISPAQVQAWSDLRNTSAHGVTPGSEDLQRLVDLCSRVTVLMYHLIFKAVGFEGLYQDYGARGWPMKRYRGRPPTEQEIAVAAYFLWCKSNREHGHDQEHWFAGKKQLEEGLA